ncbi:hypothetical protein PROFUN_03095 [Planoprotostelium fungivorum]|uniref:Uncharacterized protein n=1 Tax=Planoprotostelium fungivorum TaxID=1890364 RepID=A0A2P6NQC6_9EUKA|nr:hypothetical protein PROFUN_03095 [Planoprotostelium fungivorum]
MHMFHSDENPNFCGGKISNLKLHRHTIRSMDENKENILKTGWQSVRVKLFSNGDSISSRSLDKRRSASTESVKRHSVAFVNSPLMIGKRTVPSNNADSPPVVKRDLKSSIRKEEIRQEGKRKQFRFDQQKIEQFTRSATGDNLLLDQVIVEERDISFEPYIAASRCSFRQKSASVSAFSERPDPNFEKAKLPTYLSPPAPRRSKRVPKVGSLSAIIRWLIAENTDSKLLSCFLCNLSAFKTKAVDILQTITNIYGTIDCTNSSYMTKTKGRVIEFSIIWLESCPAEECQDPYFIEKLNEFSSILLVDSFRVEVDEISSCIQRIHDQQLLIVTEELLQNDGIVPGQKVNVTPVKQQQGLRSRATSLVSPDSKNRILKLSDSSPAAWGPVKFKHMTVHDIATQLHAIETEIFCRIDIRKEFNNVCWTKVDSRVICPNITSLIDRSNRVSFWVVTEIMTCIGENKQTEAIKKFISIGIECKRRNNFNSSMEVFAGLSVHTVNRLTNAWRNLPEKSRREFEELENFFSAVNNYRLTRERHYRAELRRLNGMVLDGTYQEHYPYPLLPYLGVILRDVLFCDEANDNYVDLAGNRVINFFKMRILGSILHDVQMYQNSPQISRLEHEGDLKLQNYLTNLVIVPEERLIIVGCLIDKDDLNLTDAESAMLLSYSAYCNITALTSWDCYWCSYHQVVFNSPSLQEVKTFQDAYGGNIFGYSGVTRDYIVISFRGTRAQDLSNWLTDLSYEMTSPFHEAITGAKVHSGFLNAYVSVRDQLLKIVGGFTTKYPKKTILFTGHSLGGALTVLAAVDTYLIKAFKNRVLIHTLGAPRVGNPQFAAFVDETFPSSIRITNRYDPVPRLPLQSMGFLHYGWEHWTPYGNTTMIPCNYKKGEEDEKCIDSLWPWQTNLFDHLEYFGLNKRIGKAFGC